MTRRDNLVDEGRPIVRPFLLEDRDEDEVQLVEEGALGAAAIIAVRQLDNKIDNKVADAWARSALNTEPH
jgi:hypothetical protein